MRSQLPRARVIRHLDRERAAPAGARDPLVEGEPLLAAADPDELQVVGHSPELAQPDESRCPSNADLVDSNRAHASWGRVFVGMLVLLLGPLFASFAADNGFYLSMPITYSGSRLNCSGATGDCGWINSVFDHSMASSYAEDGTIRAFDGSEAVVPVARRGYLSVAGNQAHCDGGNAANSSYFSLAGQYRGVISEHQQRLCYDGHPGIDMYGSYGTPVLAAADGYVRYDSAGDNCSLCVNTIKIEHPNTSYTTWYMHIQATGRIADNTWVTRGQQIALVGTDGTISAHLHFEVRRNNIPTDPFGWSGSGADPYTPTPNIDLWTPPVSCSTPVGSGATNPQLFINAYTRNGGQSAVGCPTNLVHAWGNGTIQDFTGGSGGTGGIMLANGASTAWSVQGPMWTKYVSLGGVDHALGYPASDVSGISTASTGTQLSYQQFQGNGALEWHRSGARNGQVYEVHGAIYTKWGQIGFALWWGGMPISDEKAAPTSPQGHIGRVSDFERGHIWWLNGAAAALETHGSIDTTYMSQNGPGGCLGFPLTDEFVNGSGRAQNNFENGYITTLNGVNYQIFCGTPTITTQPANQTVASGQTATLSVAATGTAPLTHQWYVGTSGNISSPIGGAISDSYITPSLISNTSYWVRVSNGTGHADSNTATIAVAFTDSPLVAGTTVIKMVHFTELRNRINAIRSAVGRGAYPWTNTLTAGTTPIRAADIIEMRTALHEVYDVAGQPRPSYSTSPGVGVTVVVADIAELRTAILAIESNANAPSYALSWATRASMPTARSRLGLVADGGKLYAIGGSTLMAGSDVAVGTVEEYNPSTNSWTTKASMPTPRFNIGVATAPNGRIYVFGSSSQVEEYDPTTNTWATKASMPTARFGPGVAAAPNGKIYVIGGGNGPIVYSTVEEYNPATNTWATKASMPTARYNLGVAMGANGKIYAVGGFTGQDATGNSCCRVNVLEEYDPLTNSWSTKAPAFTARGHLGMVAGANGRLYMIGGSLSDPSNATTTEEYDPSTNSWNIQAGMPTPRWGAGVALANNGKIYAIGGGLVNTNEEATIIARFSR